MQTFCTIITSDYIPFAKVLLHSLEKSEQGIRLQVLVIDEDDLTSSDGITFHSIKTIADSPLGKSIVEKYAPLNPDHFRWALKPLFLFYLLQNGFDKAIYIDPDIYFVNKFDFLFEKLDQSDILLTPHWSNTDPLVHEDELYHVLLDGVFNAGFIAANSKGSKAIYWWAQACHFKMEKNRRLGLFDDQKYLDILAVHFENVEVLRHKGCNLASWNIDTCKREIVDGKLMINGQFEPVFIHFTKETIANIINQNDKLLIPYLEEYSALLKKENFDLQERFHDLDFAKMYSKIAKWKYKLRPRTRLKRFLHKLVERI
jgi:lipopolysaccharide biosynthesis glycosyltransferase